jgi:hypothetical protein
VQIMQEQLSADKQSLPFYCHNSSPHFPIPYLALPFPCSLIVTSLIRLSSV